MRFSLLPLLISLGLLWPSLATAISAKLLLEGVWRVRTIHNLAEADHWYDDSGDRQPLGSVGLSNLTEKGVTTTVPNVYAISNSARYRLQRTDLTLEYGLDDTLSLAIWVPYFDHQTSQSATLTPGIGWGGLAAAQQAQLIGATATLDNSDPAHAALGDIHLGFKQQIYNRAESPLRFSLGGGINMPTGHVADPLDSSDTSTGDGQWDLSLWSWTDFKFSENFFINLHTRHSYGFASERDALFPSDPSQSANMEFQPALLHHLQLEAQQKILLNGWALLPSLMLIYDAQGEEKRQSFNLAGSNFSGSMNAVEGTDWERLMIKPTLGIGFRPLGIPARLYLSYIHTLSGRNTPDTDSIELRMELFFRGLME